MCPVDTGGEGGAAQPANSTAAHRLYRARSIPTIAGIALYVFKMLNSPEY
jgi:hypothetical protein